MEIIRARDYNELSDTACRLVCEAVAEKPGSVLGFATGSTMIGLYQRLVAAHQSGQATLSGIHGVNLDEYVGLGTDHPLSFYHYMRENLYGPIGQSASRIHIPDGLAENLEAECKRFDAQLHTLGDIDLQVLGIGVNGHIGFNEPGNCFIKGTHVVQLSPSTRRRNARFFGSDIAVPSRAITLGVGAIMGARKILLLAGGREKSTALKMALGGDITPRLPASILNLHPCVTVITDADAWPELNHLPIYEPCVHNSGE